jgi:hypothetical protein
VDAIALEFPRRVSVAVARLKAWPAQPLCRATADIILSHHSSGGTAPLDARRFPLDVDAVNSSISTLGFAPLAASDQSLLAVEFLSTHAGAGWTGSVQWNAYFTTDPMREVGRIPGSYGKHLVGADSATREGTLQIVRETAAGIELSALDMGSRSLSTKTVLIPPGHQRSGSGAALLSRL